MGDYSAYSLVASSTGAIGAHGVIMVIAWIFLSQVTTDGHLMHDLTTCGGDRHIRAPHS